MVFCCSILCIFVSVVLVLNSDDDGVDHNYDDQDILLSKSYRRHVAKIKPIFAYPIYFVQYCN